MKPITLSQHLIGRDGLEVYMGIEKKCFDVRSVLFIGFIFEKNIIWDPLKKIV